VVMWMVQDYLLYAAPHFSITEARRLAGQYGLAAYVPAQGAGDGSSWENVAYLMVQPPPSRNGMPGRSRGTIIFAHGNSGSALHCDRLSKAMEPLGFRVILYEYPGYGSNPGKPGEEANVVPLRKLVRTVAAEGSGDSSRVYLFGQSMGCGVVCSALRDKMLPVSGVILLQPWDTLAGVAGSQYPFLPVSLIVGGKYDSLTNLAEFSRARAAESGQPAVPVSFITCANDRTIPPGLSRRVYDAYPGPKLWIQHPNCGHGNWPSKPELEWWKTVTDFVSR
ncbi:MAG: alpha/beta hydrolase, partial [Candidatus Methylacidiphilales bacterium]